MENEPLGRLITNGRDTTKRENERIRPPQAPLRRGLTLGRQVSVTLGFGKTVGLHFVSF